MNAVTKIMSRLALQKQSKKAPVSAPEKAPEKAEIPCPNLRVCSPVFEPEKPPEKRGPDVMQNSYKSTTKHTAITASPEWFFARDKYINHLMACPTCYAPVNRYCPAGEVLRQQYDQSSTP